MAQIHKRFTAEQVKMLFRGYSEGNLSRAEIEEMLEIGKTRFFKLLNKYRENPVSFSIDYQRIQVPAAGWLRNANCRSNQRVAPVEQLVKVRSGRLKDVYDASHLSLNLSAYCSV